MLHLVGGITALSKQLQIFCSCQTVQQEALIRARKVLNRKLVSLLKINLLVVILMTAKLKLKNHRLKTFYNCFFLQYFTFQFLHLLTCLFHFTLLSVLVKLHQLQQQLV